MHQLHLAETIYLLVAAIAIVVLFKRINLSPVLGYLVAGAVIGPHGLQLIHDQENIALIAELGVVFLLFYIGLELSLERLLAIRKLVFGLGGMQFALTSGIIGVTIYLLGFEPQTAIIVGGGLALSSTAVVLQLLAERHEQATQVGRLSLAILILQDLAVVPLLILVPLLGDETASLGTALAEAGLSAIVVLVSIVIIGKFLLKPIFSIIGKANSQELFTATTLLIVLGAAAASQAGGLSLALGAFVAGLLVAETEYRLQVETDIKPFQGLFMGLFFMTVGMAIQLPMFVDNLALIVGVTLAYITLKGLIIAGLARYLHFRRACSVSAGSYLCQGSEFAFALFVLAKNEGVVPEQLAQILLVVVSLSMAITPMLVSSIKILAKRFEDKSVKSKTRGMVAQESQDLADHIIIIGLGSVGKNLCHILNEEEIHNFVVVDSDADNVAAARQAGYPVHFGHAERVSLLKSIGIERARMIVIAVPGKREPLKILKAIRDKYKDIQIIARCEDRAHAKAMQKAGANFALSEELQSTSSIGRVMLEQAEIPEVDIKRLLGAFNAES